MQFEKPLKKCEIKKENIIPLYELPQKISEELESLGWQLEMQGSGRFLEDGRNFEVRYPAGDMFYSWNVIIHELGHLRQDELSDEIAEEKDEVAQNMLKENDAKIRGWERMKKYAPDLLMKIKQEFEEYKQAGSIPDFGSFEELYDDFNAMNIKINKTLAMEDDTSIGYIKLKDINISDFFKKMEKNKVGTKIDVAEANEIIFKVASDIIDE